MSVFGIELDVTDVKALLLCIWILFLCQVALWIAIGCLMRRILGEMELASISITTASGNLRRSGEALSQKLRVSP